jgi:hypothetical protein
MQEKIYRFIAIQLVLATELSVNVKYITRIGYHV